MHNRILAAILLVVTGISSAAAQGSANSASALEAWSQSVSKRLQVIGGQLQKAAEDANLALPNGAGLTVNIQVTKAGRIASATIARPSGFPALDELALRLVLSKNPLPQMPAGVPNGVYMLVQPISFFGFAPELGRVDQQ